MPAREPAAELAVDLAVDDVARAGRILRQRGAGTGASATNPAGSGAGQGAQALAAVQFIDPGHGWVAGDGRIMATIESPHERRLQYTAV